MEQNNRRTRKNLKEVSLNVSANADDDSIAVWHFQILSFRLYRTLSVKYFFLIEIDFLNVLKTFTGAFCKKKLATNKKKSKIIALCRCLAHKCKVRNDASPTFL